jgi:hypothetical protein
MKACGCVSLLSVVLCVVQPSTGADAPVAVTPPLAVQEIKLSPLSAPRDQTLFTLVQIASGAMDSPPHQARVIIQTRGARSGRVPVQLIGGEGAHTNKAARLVMKSATAIGGQQAVMVETSPQGRIEGVLTSSDAAETCVIQAGGKQAIIHFTECQVDDQDALSTIWLEPGTYTNRIVVRHLRGSIAAGGKDAPGVPVAGHEMRPAVTGRLKANGFDQDSTDLSAWVHFPTNAFFSDNAGRVAIPFTITAICPVQLDAAWSDASTFDEPLSVMDSPDLPNIQPIGRHDSILEQRLAKIMIPTIQLNQASLRQTVLYLESACAASKPDDPHQAPIRFIVRGPKEQLATSIITFTARYVVALDVLKTIADVANMRYELHDSSTVLIMPYAAPVPASESGESGKSGLDEVSQDIFAAPAP